MDHLHSYIPAPAPCKKQRGMPDWSSKECDHFNTCRSEPPIRQSKQPRRWRERRHRSGPRRSLQATKGPGTPPTKSLARTPKSLSGIVGSSGDTMHLMICVTAAASLGAQRLIARRTKHAASNSHRMVRMPLSPKAWIAKSPFSFGQNSARFGPLHLRRDRQRPPRFMEACTVLVQKKVHFVG